MGSWLSWWWWELEEPLDSRRLVAGNVFYYDFYSRVLWVISQGREGRAGREGGEGAAQERRDKESTF